jgi:hypothetical protein
MPVHWAECEDIMTSIMLAGNPHGGILPKWGDFGGCFKNFIFSYIGDPKHICIVIYEKIKKF